MSKLQLVFELDKKYYLEHGYTIEEFEEIENDMANKRDRIKAKTQGRCAYCGCELPEKGWHADHIDPIFRGWENRPDRAGDDVESNLFASCRRCNLRKGTLTLEMFRSEITKQGDRLRRNVSAFRLAEDYGIVQCVESPVVFYFEKIERTR